MEERPTRRDYIEILMCRAILRHLEDSRSHGKEAEAERSQDLAPAQVLRAPALLQRPITFNLADYAPPT